MEACSSTTLCSSSVQWPSKESPKMLPGRRNFATSLSNNSMMLGFSAFVPRDVVETILRLKFSSYKEQLTNVYRNSKMQMRPSRQWSKTTFNSSRWKPVKRVQHCCQQAACEIWKSVQCTITHSILSFSWQQPRPLQKCTQMRNNVRHSTELVWGRAFYKKTWWHFPDAKSC